MFYISKDHNNMHKHFISMYLGAFPYIIVNISKNSYILLTKRSLSYNKGWYSKSYWFYI